MYFYVILYLITNNIVLIRRFLDSHKQHHSAAVVLIHQVQPDNVYVNSSFYPETLDPKRKLLFSSYGSIVRALISTT